MRSNKDIKREYKERKKPAGIFQVKNTILEVVEVKDDLSFNLADELTLLEQIWLEKLDPFGERGYNTDSNIRQA